MKKREWLFFLALIFSLWGGSLIASHLYWGITMIVIGLGLLIIKNYWRTA